MEKIVTSFLTGIAMFLFACGSDNELDDIAKEGILDTTSISVIPDLRVMTYNIHLANLPSAGDKRDLPAIARVINESKADLVALQEVDIYTERSGLSIHQARELGKLTNLYAFYVKAMDVFGGGEYGIAILSRFPILDSVGYELPPDPEVGGEMRMLGMIRVALPDGREIIFAGTHLDHRSEQNRLFQGERIQKILQRENSPVILAGDFNAVPQTLTVDFFDNYYTRTCSHNCSPTFPAYDPKSAIDFIMLKADNAIEVVAHKIIFESYASDHLPVVADLKIN